MFCMVSQDDPVNEEIPNSTLANLRVSGTDGLMSPLKDAKENLL